ncbi:MAG: CopG family transcriptional regulator [Candidatus Sumerlaeota bacterium]|nr:CopG family transcriptional regulator [Candidatus Sumerlaeota bacterium]
MPNKRKHEIITFKAEDSLAEAMARIPNRSEFIRAAVLAALDNVCPLCMGSGILTPDQRRHWDAFAKDHQIETCGDCNGVEITCSSHKAEALHKRPAKSSSKTNS